MESLERTATPREDLFSLQQYLQTIIASKGEFYSELAKITKEDEFDSTHEQSVSQSAIFFNDLYTITVRDEDGDIESAVNVLEIIKSKFSELGSKIEAALENKNNFGTLIHYLEGEQRQIHDNVLFASLVENKEAAVEGDLDVLSDWYNNILTKVISIIDRIYSEPELDLSRGR